MNFLLSVSIIISAGILLKGFGAIVKLFKNGIVAEIKEINAGTINEINIKTTEIKDDLRNHIEQDELFQRNLLTALAEKN